MMMRISGSLTGDKKRLQERKAMTLGTLAAGADNKQLRN